MKFKFKSSGKKDVKLKARDHNSSREEPCSPAPKGINYEASHLACDKGCPVWALEKKTQEICLSSGRRNSGTCNLFQSSSDPC